MMLRDLLTGAVVLAAAAYAIDVAVVAAADGVMSPAVAAVAAVLVTIVCLGAGRQAHRLSGAAVGLRVRWRDRTGVTLDVDGDGRMRITGDVAAMFAATWSTYVLWGARTDRPLYVGQSKNGPRYRIHDHASKPWGHQIRAVDVRHHQSEQAMTDAENDLIATLDPIHNIARPSPRSALVWRR